MKNILHKIFTTSLVAQAARLVFVGAVGSLMLWGMNSCATQETDNDPNLLVRIGHQRLTRSDLEKAMSASAGGSGTDSVRVARAYITNWINNHLMSEIAERNIPDMTEIDRMVSEYRNELISWEYRRLMFQQHVDNEYPPDSIAAYYEEHKDRFVNQRPLVKGVYIKIASDSPSLPRVKKLYKSTLNNDIDRLEKEDLKGLIHYDYFRDRWVDWEQIETRIPYRYEGTPDDFLATHHTLEVSANGYTHLLEITEYLNTGTIMPLEHAVDRIKRDMFNKHRAEYDTQLRIELLNQGLTDGSIIINVPLQD